MGLCFRSFFLLALVVDSLAAPSTKNYRAPAWKSISKRDHFDAFGWTLPGSSSNDRKGDGPSYNPISNFFEQDPDYHAITDFDFDSLVCILPSLYLSH
jgi:hypothetical protein